jgi:hypothetical protein
MEDTKYIVDGITGHIVPIGYTHRTYSELLGLTEIVSAGFVSFGSFGMPRCYGRSTSLNKDSRPEEDTRIMKNMFGKEDDGYSIHGEELYEREKKDAERWRTLLRFARIRNLGSAQEGYYQNVPESKIHHAGFEFWTDAPKEPNDVQVQMLKEEREHGVKVLIDMVDGTVLPSPNYNPDKPTLTDEPVDADTEAIQVDGDVSVRDIHKYYMQYEPKKG